MLSFADALGLPASRPMVPPSANMRSFPDALHHADRPLQQCQRGRSCQQGGEGPPAAALSLPWHQHIGYSRARCQLDCQCANAARDLATMDAALLLPRPDACVGPLAALLLRSGLSGAGQGPTRCRDEPQDGRVPAAAGGALHAVAPRRAMQTAPSGWGQRAILRQPHTLWSCAARHCHSCSSVSPLI